MEKSKVYFTDFRTHYGGKTMPQKLQHLIKEAGIDNIDIIQQRILFDFNSNILSEGFTLHFSLNESIESEK